MQFVYFLGLGRIAYSKIDKRTFKMTSVVFSDEWIQNVYNLTYKNVILYTMPLYQVDASSVSDTKPLKRHDEDKDEDEEEIIVGEDEDMVDLEDLGVAKCGVHLDGL